MEVEGERTGGDAALPSELANDRRKEQRERGARVDADRHGDERHRDDQPAVEEGKTHRETFRVRCSRRECLLSARTSAPRRAAEALKKSKRNAGLASISSIRCQS